MQLEQCPDCGIQLPTYPQDARPTHKYIGASASCWELFVNLNHASVPSLASYPGRGLILDAYCVQHHSVPSPAAIQSVAVHLLVLYGVFMRDVPLNRAQWIRERGVRPLKIHRHERYHWLTPPSQTDLLTIGDIVNGESPAERTAIAQKYVKQVSELWLSVHETAASEWYDKFIAA